MTQIWLEVDSKGNEFMYDSRSENYYSAYSIQLPEGSIEKLIGRKLTWDDDAVMVEGDLR